MLKFTWILNVRETVESLTNGDGHQIYLDSKGGTGFSFQTQVSEFGLGRQLMKLDLMNRLRRACEARNV